MAGPESPHETGADAGAAAARVDGQGHEGVDQRNGVRARRFGSLCQWFDGGDVGRKLDHERPACHAPGSRHHFAEQRRIARKVSSAVLGVGAGDIQLVAGHAGVILDHPHHFRIIFAGEAEDIREDGRGKPGQRRQLVLNKRADSDVLQPDGVDHAARGFPHARWQIAFDGFPRQALHHQAAERVEIQQALKFHAVRESAGGGDDRIAQRDTTQAGGQRGIPGAAHSASASARMRPVDEEGGGTPQARARVGARSIASTDDSNNPLRNRGPYRHSGTLVS